MTIEHSERLRFRGYIPEQENFTLVDSTKPQRDQYPDMNSYLDASEAWFKRIGRAQLQTWLDERLAVLDNEKEEETEEEARGWEEFFRRDMGDENYEAYQKWLGSQK